MMPFSVLSLLDIVGRLALALGLGALIGFDREYSKKAAGLRTNMLVSLGAAMFVMVPLQAGLAAADASTMGRVIQGIVTGVGFVGAGSILHAGRVRGLTSAAAVWISASIGVAAGMGLWELGLVGTLFALTTLRCMKWLEKNF
jgi:putative Mg2+ transporter-C (MgtC) family protein